MPQVTVDEIYTVYEVPNWVAIAVLASAVCVALLIVWFFWPRRD